MLMGSPNSSFIWIQYMAFMMSLAEIDKAREIAERAIKRIHYREEEELKNVWKAYVNLECIYGSSETLMAVTKRALSAVTNQLDIYLHLFEMYHSGGKHEEAEELFKIIRKKH